MPQGIIDSRVCDVCEIQLPLSDYYRHNGCVDRRCKQCYQTTWGRRWVSENKERKRTIRRERARRTYEARRDKVVAWARKYRFGVDQAAYNALFEAQSGVCAICRRPETASFRGRVKQLSLDHDHQTGRIRGLLCGNCNIMIGQAQDSIVLLTSMIDYLRAPRSIVTEQTNGDWLGGADRPNTKRERSIAIRRFKLFGVSLANYQARLKQQGMTCAICRKPETVFDPRLNTVRRLSVDHDHRTGVVRGLLCWLCNSALGRAEDSIDRLAAAIGYIR
jgi:hypothetical protein